MKIALITGSCVWLDQSRLFFFQKKDLKFQELTTIQENFLWKRWRHNLGKKKIKKRLKKLPTLKYRYKKFY